MRKRVLAGLIAAGALAAVMSLVYGSPVTSSKTGKKSAASICPPTPSAWTGHNAHLAQYYVAPGYPAYDAHPRYLGELSGSWHDIGKQYGERGGDLIRLTFEGWYKELLPVQGSNQAIIDYVHREEAYYSALVPEALELMKGIAEGAKEDLDSSAYANTMTNYEKVLMINSYFGLQAKPAQQGRRRVRLRATQTPRRAAVQSFLEQRQKTTSRFMSALKISISSRKNIWSRSSQIPAINERTSSRLPILRARSAVSML